MTTNVTAAQIAELRRKVAEPHQTTYPDDLLVTYIEKYPLLDELGEEPYTWVQGNPPTTLANPSWVPTYDLNAAAADIWEEKATTVIDQYDFSADGGSFSRSQLFASYTKAAAYYRSRRSMHTIRMHKTPEEPSGTISNWIANAPEPPDA